MNVGYDCRVLCGSNNSPSKFTEAESSTLHYRITNEYFIHLIGNLIFVSHQVLGFRSYLVYVKCCFFYLVDNLPCATVFQIPETTELQYEPGFRLGFVRGDKAYINNHLSLQLKYHYSETEQVYRVVGFQVETNSIDKARLTIAQDGVSCSIKDEATFQEVNPKSNELFFTYSVKWEKSPIRWASRWDIYLNMADVQIHWFSIVNSVVVVFFLSGIITMIIIRTLRR